MREVSSYERKGYGKRGSFHHVHREKPNENKEKEEGKENQ